LLLRTADFTAVSWTKSGLAATPVIADAVTSPDGTLTADKIVESSTTAQHYLYQSRTTTAVSHTISLYAKAAERSFIYVQCDDPSVAQYFNISTGVLGNAFGSQTSTITAVGNGWYRCTMTFTGVAATPAVYVMISSANGTNSYAGDGTSGVYLWGAQLEAGSFATSYIPVGATTAGATRNPDVASVGTNQFPYSATEGTLVFSGSIIGSLGAATVDFVQLSNGVSNSVAIDIGVFSLGSIFQVLNSTTQASLSLGSMSVGSAVKIAGAYKADDFAGVLSNGTVQTDVSGTVPTGITTMGIGYRLGGVYMNGHVRQITYIPRRLSNAELQARTV
jgi:hypothetical protein